VAGLDTGRVRSEPPNPPGCTERAAGSGDRALGRGCDVAIDELTSRMLLQRISGPETLAGPADHPVNAGVALTASTALVVVVEGHGSD
jgi:hypothetical protein